jgi:hypothetical protein
MHFYTDDAFPSQDEEEETWKSILRASFAEFVGSALFVYIACGAATTTANYTSPVLRHKAEIIVVLVLSVYVWFPYLFVNVFF